MALKRVFVTYRLPEEILRPLNDICDLEVWAGTKPMTPSELFSAIFDRDGIICLLTDEITSSLLENQEKLNFISIRLDTFSQNKSNNKFYESRGYQKLGDVFFRKQSEFPFHCYEKILN